MTTNWPADRNRGQNLGSFEFGISPGPGKDSEIEILRIVATGILVILIKIVWELVATKRSLILASAQPDQWLDQAVVKIIRLVGV